jgi:hypothetical protein
MKVRLARWWHIQLLRFRGWPEPEQAIDWLEQRRSILGQRHDG